MATSASIDTIPLLAVHRHADAEAQHQHDQEEDEEEGEPVCDKPGVVGDRLDPDLAGVAGLRLDAADRHQLGAVAVQAEDQTLVVGVGAVLTQEAVQQLDVDGRVWKVHEGS